MEALRLRRRATKEPPREVLRRPWRLLSVSLWLLPRATAELEWDVRDVMLLYEDVDVMASH